jgi:hypothetical protein
MATTSIGSTGVTFPDASLQSTSGVTLVNGKGPGVVQSVIVSGTAIASTSGTSIDFTSIPSWAKRITMMLGGVSTNGASATIIQVGAGSFTTSGYLGACASGSDAAAPNVRQPTNGIQIIAETGGSSSYVRQGTVTFSLVTSNLWVASGVGSESAAGRFWTTGGSIFLGATLDRIRLTTANGTDAFDAGTVNIFYE